MAVKRVKIYSVEYMYVKYIVLELIGKERESKTEDIIESECSHLVSSPALWETQAVQLARDSSAPWVQEQSAESGMIPQERNRKWHFIVYHLRNT